MTPRVLYFDLGKVLLEFSHQRMCRQMAEVAGITSDAVRDAIFGDEDCHAAQIQYETGHISTAEFFERFCGAAKVTPDRALLAAAVCEIFTPIEPMLELAQRLTAADNRLAILSNTNPLQWEYIADGRFPLISPGRTGSAFEWAILSYEVKAMKPAPAIYEAAIERAGVKAEEIFFTDDRLENVEGAIAMGIDAVLFTGYESLAEELGRRNVAGA